MEESTAAPQGQRGHNIFPDDVFGTDIFAYLGLTNITPSQKQQLLVTMLETIQSRVVSRMLDAFDDIQRVDLEKALEDKDADTINALLESKGLPPITQLIAEEVVLYKIEVMSLFAEAK